MNNCLVSVIVPIYNREKYLHRCLDSILAQTHQNLEVLCVDDGSTDASGQICGEYAQKDKRVKVLHIPNGGVSNARNIGLDNANGEYILFVDSDDWIDKNHIQLLFPTEEIDVVCCNCVLEKPFIKENNPKEAVKFYIYTFQQNFEKYYGKYCIMSPCRILYKKDILDRYKIRFIQDISYGEDEIFNMYYLSYCKTVAKVDNYTYHYWRAQGENSLCEKYHGNRLQCIKAKMQACEFFSERELLKMRLLYWRFVMKYYQAHRSKRNTREIQKDAKKQLKGTYKEKYFRESISYMRKNGTLDEKIESYFMGYYKHMFFKPTYAIVKLLYRIKVFLRRLIKIKRERGK